MICVVASICAFWGAYSAGLHVSGDVVITDI